MKIFISILFVLDNSQKQIRFLGGVDFDFLQVGILVGTEDLPVLKGASFVSSDYPPEQGFSAKKRILKRLITSTVNLKMKLNQS